MSNSVTMNDALSSTLTLSTDQLMERFIGDMNGAARLLMMAIGHRVGLFDVMTGMEPATSREIAARGDLHERYVREWLGAMVTARIVAYEPSERTYQLKDEAAACLTRASVPQNLASMAQWIAVMGSVEEKVVEAFQTGKGVPYCAYHRFHDVMAEESEQTVGAMLDEAILPLEPGLKEKLQKGIRVLDVGCGAGRTLVRLATMYPKSQFVGYDLSEQAVSMGNEAVDRRGLTNLCFQAIDATAIKDVNQYDLILAFDAIHDQAHPDIVLVNLNRALKDDGCFLMQDIYTSSHLEKNLEHPLGTFLYAISCSHCMSVSLAQGGAGLGACWGEELAVSMLREAGFEKTETYRLEHDVMNNYYVCHKA